MNLRDVQKVLDYTSAYYDITTDEMLSKSRKAELIRAKHASIYLIYTLLNGTKIEIARLLGMDHSSIIHAIKSVEGGTFSGRAEDIDQLALEIADKILPKHCVDNRNNKPKTIKLSYGDNQDCCGMFYFSVS